MANSRKTSRSKAVQSTNDSSIVSKLSMTQAGYFKDPFLKYFVSKPAQRTSLINRGYYIRAAAISQVLTSFLDGYSSSQALDSGSNDQMVQIISLGAGFDTSFFRLTDAGRACRYIEVDFPQVIHRKLEIIHSTPTLNSKVNPTSISEDTKLHHTSYHAVGCDLRDIPALQQTLDKLCVNYRLPSLLLSECVLTYVETTKVNSLLEWCSKSFTNAVFCTYEQIHPNDGFGLIMQQHFSSLGSSLKNINSFPTRRTHEGRFKMAGWDVCMSCDMNDFYFSLPLPEQRRVNSLELFDEFEEWHSKCSHYMLLCAATGSCVESVKGLLPYAPTTPSVDIGIPERTLEVCELPLSKDSNIPTRYAHASVQLSTGDVVVLCGFGVSPSSRVHSRLNDVITIKPGDNEEGDKEWKCVAMTTIGRGPGAVMHHKAVLLSENRVLVYGGRMSPAKPSGAFYLLTFPGNNQAQYEEICLGSKSSLMEPRWRHSMNVITNEGSECVVIAGGQSTANVTLNDCFCLNTTDWTLTKLPVSLPEGRHSHCALTHGSDDAGRVVIIGGLNSDMLPLSSCLELSCVSPVDEWTMSSVEFNPPLPGRYGMSGCVIGDEAWLVGGVSLKPRPEILRLNLVDKTWIEYSIKTSIGVGPILLHGHTAHFTGDQRGMVVLGGGGNCFSFGTHINSHPLLVKLPEL